MTAVRDALCSVVVHKRRDLPVVVVKLIRQPQVMSVDP